MSKFLAYINAQDAARSSSTVNHTTLHDQGYAGFFRILRAGNPFSALFWSTGRPDVGRTLNIYSGVNASSMHPLTIFAILA